MTFKKGNIISIKGGEARRSPELKKAWGEQDKLIELNNQGWSINKIAKEYKINERSCHRIVKGT